MHNEAATRHQLNRLRQDYQQAVTTIQSQQDTTTNTGNDAIRRPRSRQARRQVLLENQGAPPTLGSTVPLPAPTRPARLARCQLLLHIG